MKIENLIGEKIKQEFDKDKDVIAVLVFGSYVRNELHRDIDLCIVLDNKRSNLEMSKKAIYYGSLVGSKFDISIYQQLPLYIRKRVLMEGKVILCKDEGLLYKIAFEAIKEFELYEKLYNMYLEKVKNG